MTQTIEWLDKRVEEVLSYVCKHNVTTQENVDNIAAGIKENNPGAPDAVVRKYTLAKMGVQSFLAYSAILNFDVFASPSVYPKIARTRIFSTKPIFFLMMPRGTWKSVWGLAAWEEWLYLRSRSLGNKQAINICFIHGNIDKANSDLDTVRQHVKMELVQYLYGDIFKITTDNATQLDFEDNISSIPLKECAFEVGSVESDLAGKHFARLALDDFSTDKNCATIDANEKNKRAFYRLFSLADRVEGRIMAIDYIGTPYYHGSITEELEKDKKWDKWCERIIVQASKEFFEDDGERRIVYPFHQLPKEQLDMYRDTLPSTEYMSQYYMQYYDRDEGLPPIIELPEYYDPLDESNRLYSPIEWCGLLVDPANSKSQKNRKSLMTILVAVVTEKKEIFIVDGCFLKGVTPSEFREKMEDYAKVYPIEDAVIEAIAAQEYMANDIREHSELGAFGRYFRVIQHRHYENKREHYRSFLEPLFRRDLIRINPDLRELLDELARVSSYEDAIDCFSFIKELRFSFMPPEPEMILNESDKKWHDIKKIQKKLKRRPVFGIVSPWI